MCKNMRRKISLLLLMTSVYSNICFAGLTDLKANKVEISKYEYVIMVLDMGFNAYSRFNLWHWLGIDDQYRIGSIEWGFSQERLYFSVHVLKETNDYPTEMDCKALLGEVQDILRNIVYSIEHITTEESAAVLDGSRVVVGITTDAPKSEKHSPEIGCKN